MLRGAVIFQTPIFLRGDKMKGSENLLMERHISFPLYMWSHNKEKCMPMFNQCPASLHSIWSPSQCSFFIFSLSLPQHSPGPCLSTPWHLFSLPNNYLNVKFKFWFYVLRKFSTASDSKHEVLESVLAEADCTTLFFKNSPQISLASWICSRNITLPFVILPFSYFWSIFEDCQDCLEYAAIQIQQMALVLSKHYGNLLYS